MENLNSILQSSIAREENNKKRNELEKVDVSYISQSPRSFLKDQMLMEEMLNKNQTLNTWVSTSNFHLRNFLDRFESAWDSDEQCSSPEIAREYLDAAKYMQGYFNRIDNRIEGVEKWLNDYLPFK